MKYIHIISDRTKSLEDRIVAICNTLNLNIFPAEKDVVDILPVITRNAPNTIPYALEIRERYENNVS